MMKQLLNSGIAKYRDLTVSRRSISCLNLRLRQIIDLLATDKVDNLLKYFTFPLTQSTVSFETKSPTVSMWTAWTTGKAYVIVFVRLSRVEI